MEKEAGNFLKFRTRKNIHAHFVVEQSCVNTKQQPPDIYVKAFTSSNALHSLILLFDFVLLPALVLNITNLIRIVKLAKAHKVDQRS